MAVNAHNVIHVKPQILHDDVVGSDGRQQVATGQCATGQEFQVLGRCFSMHRDELVVQWIHEDHIPRDETRVYFRRVNFQLK